jgi:hypothetical protein
MEASVAPVPASNHVRMTDEELIKFGKDVRRLAENPFQRQLEEARREWKRRNQLRDSKNK